MSYRQPIFIENQHYRSLQPFRSGPTAISRENEKLAFQQDYYVPYDDSFVYEFKNLSTGETKQWWLHHGKPNETWHAFFANDK